MQVSLNNLVHMLADRVGQPFSIPLQEQLKVILNYKRADWFQKVLDKHPEQRKYYFKDFTAELQRVDKAECPIDVDCTVLRTVYQVPVPVRTELTLFDYVGDPDKLDGYGYATPEQIQFLKMYNKYTADRPRYFYINGYIYIYNEAELDYINVRGVWSDPRQLSAFKCDDVACYTDDDQYNIPEDVINLMIQDVLKGELKLLMAPEQGEVTVDDQQTKQ